VADPGWRTKSGGPRVADQGWNQVVTIGGPMVAYPGWPTEKLPITLTTRVADPGWDRGNTVTVAYLWWWFNIDGPGVADQVWLT